jgi:hypothetical protein
MRRLVVVAVSACALTLAMPASAHAQFGGLVRRAAERVVKKDNPSSDQPRMDEATVTHMLAGLTEEAKVADSIGRATLAQHAGVIGEVDSFLKRWAVYSTALVDAHRAQVEYQSCVSGPSQELASMAQAPSASPPPGSMALAQRMESMSDEEREAFQAKLDKLEKEAKAAEKSGNVAEQQRIRAEVGKLTGVSVTQHRKFRRRQRPTHLRRERGRGTECTDDTHRQRERTYAGRRDCARGPALPPRHQNAPSLWRRWDTAMISERCACSAWYSSSEIPSGGPDSPRIAALA